jgi:two-component system OmpR family response regulator
MRILLAEDDVRLAEGLRQDLQKAGYAVDWVADGGQALSWGDATAFDAVILDLGLPRHSGLEVLEHWRKRGNRVPVLILSARHTWAEKVAGLKAGADDYLAKPFSVEELLARLEALLRRSHGQAGPAIGAFGLSLDSAACQAILPDGRRVALTATELRLLRALLLHPGRVLSKAKLAEHLYDWDAERDSNVIEVYVRRLRDKLGADWIETRRGLGYLLRKPHP